MKGYPVTVRRPSYRGADPRKQKKHYEVLRVAARVEAYLNAELAKLPNNSIQVFLNYSVAREIGEDPKAVADIINGTDGGSNGITLVKGSFEKARDNMGRPPEDWDHA